MIAILFFGGMQMVMMGVPGEYLWCTLSEAQQRPRYLVEAVVGNHWPRPAGANEARC